MANAPFWAGKRVFLTGHTGFKGGWLALWLQSLGATVRGYALPPPSRPSLFETAKVGSGMDSVIADIRDRERLRREMQSFRPDVVIHMAAQPLVRASYNDPVETYETNVMGTVHLLEAVRNSDSVRVVVNVTSDKCYENRERDWGYRETDPMGGHDPYSSSKGCAELVTSAYVRSFFHSARTNRHGAAVASVRAGNVIGGGDWAKDRLVPDIMRAYFAGILVNIRNPQSVRPWQHVLDPLGGYLLLAERLWDDGRRFAGAWNFGPDEDDVQPVSGVLDVLRSELGEGLRWEQRGEQNAPHEAAILKLDIGKAQEALGWCPRYRLREAVAATAAWYRAAQEGNDMQAFTCQQICYYTALDDASPRASAFAATAP